MAVMQEADRISSSTHGPIIAGSVPFFHYICHRYAVNCAFHSLSLCIAWAWEPDAGKHRLKPSVGNRHTGMWIVM